MLAAMTRFGVLNVPGIRVAGDLAIGGKMDFVL